MLSLDIFSYLFGQEFYKVKFCGFKTVRGHLSHGHDWASVPRIQTYNERQRSRLLQKALISAACGLPLLPGRQSLTWKVRVRVGLGHPIGFTQPRGQEQGSQGGATESRPAYHVLPTSHGGHFNLAPAASPYLKPG